MTFENEKKTFLAKLDKSKKGDIDTRAIPLITTINAKKDFYTTSSCSGRVYLWQGTGKKNETQWLSVSHDPIDPSFFQSKEPGLIWLRYEAFIMHVACRDLAKANQLLQIARTIYKKSSILSASNKIIVELHASQFIEMPLYQNHELLFSGNLQWLTDIINTKLQENWQQIELLRKKIEKI